MKEIHYYLSNVFRLYFPCIARIRLVVVEVGGYRARHDGRTFDAGIPQVEHNGLRETHQPKFTGIISRSRREEIGAGEAGNADKITFGSCQRAHSGPEAVKYAGEVGVNSLVPLLGAHVLRRADGRARGVDRARAHRHPALRRPQPEAERQRKVLERIHAVLKPRGLLYVGHSENFTDSRALFRLRGKTIYERV